MVRSASLFMFVAATAFGVAHAGDPAKPAADPNKLICKRHIVTGSLAESERECHTRAEWDQLAEQNRNEARRNIESVASQGGSGH